MLSQKPEAGSPGESQDWNRPLVRFRKQSRASLNGIEHYESNSLVGNHVVPEVLTNTSSFKQWSHRCKLAVGAKGARFKVFLECVEDRETNAPTIDLEASNVTSAARLPQHLHDSLLMCMQISTEANSIAPMLARACAMAPERGSVPGKLGNRREDWGMARRHGRGLARRRLECGGEEQSPLEEHEGGCFSSADPAQVRHARGCMPDRCDP